MVIKLLEQVAKLKRTWNLPQSSKLFKQFVKIIALAYIDQLVEIGNSKDIFKNGPCVIRSDSLCHRFGKSLDCLKYKNLNIFRMEHKSSTK